MTGGSKKITAFLLLLILLLMPGAVQALEQPPAQHVGQAQGSESHPDARDPSQDPQAEPADPGEPASEEEDKEFTKDPWLDRWERFRKATREISEFDIKEGMFRMRFGLRFQLDGTLGFQSQSLEDQFGRIPTTGNIRRARVFADGDFLRRFHYRFEYDFGEDDGLKDAYVDGIFGSLLRFAALRVGNSQEPFSLEQRTSNYYRGFLEASLPVEVFAPGNNMGLMLHALQARERLSWALGLYTNTQDSEDNSSASDLTITGRVTGLPLYKDSGRRLLHLGLSLSQRTPSGDTVQYASHPEARFAPIYIDTGPLAATNNILGSVEMAMVHGPWWFQTEYLKAMPDTEDFGQLDFWGFYAQLGWFLTGEHRSYHYSEGTFSRLEPIHPMKDNNPFKKGHHGALELTARISTVDLNDGEVTGGELTNLSVGLNWYLTRATRLMFNYVYSDVDAAMNDGVGHANIFMIRYQFNPGYSWPQLHPKKRRTIW